MELIVTIRMAIHILKLDYFFADDTCGGAKWYRDPDTQLAPHEITRFPHAILEVKLELGGANSEPPQWVTDLQNSGMLYEVHKFSKFIHGCAVSKSAGI